MHISQILIAEAVAQYPPYIQHCINTIQHLFSGARHAIYDDKKLADFISKNFNKSVSAAYQRLIPNAYKADLGRYCLLYKLGGWYFDIAIKPLRSIEFSSEVDLVAFRDVGLISETPYSLSNGLIYAKSNNSVFDAAIELVVKNCELGLYGVNALCPTGPNLFGQAVASQGPNSKNIFGDVIYLTPIHSNKNKAFVLPDGEIFSFFKPANGGDLSSLGVLGANNYVELYQEKRIYTT